MKAGQYDISLDQGSTFKFHITYMDSSDVGIDLDNYQTNMQVRRSFKADEMILDISGTTASTSVTGGGSTGYFSVGGGSAGTGGVYLNVSQTNVAGTTGGILVQVDFDTMKNVPHGKHFYDIELVNLSTTPNEVNRVLKGSFDVDAEVTR